MKALETAKQIQELYKKQCVSDEEAKVLCKENIQSLCSALIKAEEALRFYADKNNWRGVSSREMK